MNRIMFTAGPLIALTVLFSLVAPAGCESRYAGGPPEVVRLGYFPNLTHAQAVLGVSSGEFEQAIAPVPLRTQIFNAGPSLMEALVAGEIDVAYVGPSPVLATHARTRGELFRVVAGAAANGVVIVARKDSGITGLEDLAGRRIATPQLGNTQDVSARHYLKYTLKQDNTNNILPIANPEQVQLMQNGEIDAAWAPEPWASRLVVEAGGVVVGEEKQLWPEGQFSLTLVVTTQQFMDLHPDLLKKLLTVHVDWTERLQTEPTKHLPALGDAVERLTGKRLPPGVVPQAIERTVFTTEPLPTTLQTFAQWSYELGLSDQPPTLDGLVDLGLLQEVRRDRKGGM